MALPRTHEARVYYRAARQRHEDAQYLLEGDRTTGAVYLAGYTVECMLKALVLASVSAGLRQRLLGVFRGNRGHNLEWLGTLYRQHVGANIPRSIGDTLRRIATWSTELRYLGAVLKRKEADEFMRSVDVVTEWADARM